MKLCILKTSKTKVRNKMKILSIFLFLMFLHPVFADEIAYYNFNDRVKATKPEPAQNAESLLRKTKSGPYRLINGKWSRLHKGADLVTYVPNTAAGEKGPELNFKKNREGGSADVTYYPFDRDGMIGFHGREALITQEDIIPKNNDFSIEFIMRLDYRKHPASTIYIFDISPDENSLSILKVDKFNRQLGEFDLQYIYGTVDTQKDLELRVSHLVIHQTYHIKMLFTKKKITIFVDGKEMASVNLADEINHNSKIAFGGHLLEDKNRKYFGGIFKLLIDDIKIQKQPF
jgi:hypothetical protein